MQQPRHGRTTVRAERQRELRHGRARGGDHMRMRMRTRTRRTSIVATVAAILALATAGSAIADPAPPPNDARDNAVTLGPLPATVSGTTVGATVAPTDPSSRCAEEGGSVWYQVAVGAQAPPKLAVQVEANGELDAAVDVFVKQRSQNLPVTCQRTDKHGEAVFAFSPQK